MTKTMLLQYKHFHKVINTIERYCNLLPTNDLQCN